MAAPNLPGRSGSHSSEGDCPDRVDPVTGLPLPDPYPEYLMCPNCGEAEVEVWCYEEQVRCHSCGLNLPHQTPPCCGTAPYCKRGHSAYPESP